MKHFRLHLIVAFMFSLPVAALAHDDIMPAYERIEIMSEALSEPRAAYLYRPPHRTPGAAIPTVYLTDAKANFALVVAYLDYMSKGWSNLPAMNVVGIENVDRNRDFLPRADARFPASGEGDRFGVFIETELIPTIESRTGPASARIIVGHSFGGVNAINLLLTRPGAFDAHIAIGTSTWVSDKILFERMRERLGGASDIEGWLYMSVAEADGGLTVPDGVAFAQQFEAQAPPGLESIFEIIPRTDHFSAVPPSLDSAFGKLFDNWKAGRAVLAAARADGTGGVRNWFAEERERLGWRFHPAAWDLYVAALTLRAEGRNEEGLIVIREAQRLNPVLPELIAAEGELLMSSGDREAALAALTRALALAQDQSLDPPRVTPIVDRLRALGSTEHQ